MRAILIALLLATAGSTVLLPVASAGDTCTTYTGCLDTCNMRFCISTGPVDDTVDEVERTIEEYPVLCTYRICPNLP